MNILYRYITRQALITLALTLGVFTLVMLLGGMLRQLSDLLVNRQMSLSVVGFFLVLVTPSILSFSLPMAMLATALLVFGRLSADNELTALRASGVSLAQVAAPVVLLAVLMSGLCFYVNAELAPRCKVLFKTMFVRLGAENPMALLEEGTVIKDFPGYRIYVTRKHPRQHELEGVIIQVLDDKGNPVSRLEARRGIVTANPAAKTLLLDLYDVRGDLRDQSDPTNIHKIQAGTSAQRYPITLDLDKALRQASAAKKPGDCTLAELRTEIAGERAAGIYPATVLIEAHQRVAMALACLAFTLIGIPLGIKTSRRETSIGIALSLALAFGFYVLMIFAAALRNHPQLYPEAILWLPNLAFELIGLALLWRVTRA